MPSKNKNIIRRSKTRKQHRSRKHKRNNNNNNNNNNARNQTIRGGWRWPWRKPTPSLMERIKQKNPEFKPVALPNPGSSQPRLPTNVYPVKNALREDVSRGNREVINGLKKLIEPQIKKMKALDDEYEILEERKDKPEYINERHQMFVRRQQIHHEIARIKREKIDRSRVEDIERDIRTRERADVKYRKDHGLPPLPSDDDILLDADAEMKEVDNGAGVFGLGLDKKAVVAELELRERSRVADTNQDELSNAMNRMSVHRGSTPHRDSVETQRRQIDKVVDEVMRGVSESRSGSSARGSSAHDAPLPPSRGLPSGRRARDSSARDSSARDSRSPSP